MATMREILEECVIRGYFYLKIAFVRRGLDVPEHPQRTSVDPFYLALEVYWMLCKASIQKHPSAISKPRRLAQFARRAFGTLARSRPETTRGRGKPVNIAVDPRLLGGNLAIERALHILGIMGPALRGFQAYLACCLEYSEWITRVQPPPAAKDAVVEAIRLVTNATGRDPCDPANWAAPEAADWEQVAQISKKLWDLLGQESDPFNTLFCAPGDAAR